MDHHQLEPHDHATEPVGVIAIDAGNSKTDVALVGADGQLLGTARGGGFTPHLDGPETAVATLAPLIAAAARAAGLGATAGPLGQHLQACLANADLPVEEQQLERALAAYGWGRTVAVSNDTFGLLRAGSATPYGVAVVCGAGINCVGLLPDGRTVRFPALGQLTGDWGGGGGLAAEAMWHATRAEDGRGTATALAPAIAAHFGLPDATAVAEALHLRKLGQERLHEVVPLIFGCAERGDQAALELIDRQADEITRLVRVALTRLELLDTPTPLVLGGGVLAAEHPLLLDNLTARLHALAPQALPRIVTAPPVLGAALLGLDRLADGGLGGGEAAQRRLREAYGSTTAAVVA
ncbi:N-acetylglucosamine kinase [Kitasatospora sp. GAS204B]|uniref:N-acetylglucosamine kinase n=1 Tax=unclassified Kitasatospora TaxID=2633591 RepID=UPI002475321E|nr:BadF/BadG/BcrA/BcrD ATPase family protein [Kitasatospora sp. GAS204B]MDH6117149.1 N-acetylglucosamine kinase-like BadF-type ATPase [Kitasatospora sp. GAS204B]